MCYARRACRPAPVRDRSRATAVDCRGTGSSPGRRRGRVSFNGSAPERYDFVVGADGVHSAVRSSISTRDEPRPSLLSAASWRFMTTDPGVDCWCAWSVLAGPLLLIPLSEDQVYGLGHRPRLSGQRPEWLRVTFDHYPEPVRRGRFVRTAHTGLAVPLTRPRSARLRTWHRGRVVLIGDAAHATAPVWAQGAALAADGCARPRRTCWSCTATGPTSDGVRAASAATGPPHLATGSASAARFRLAARLFLPLLGPPPSPPLPRSDSPPPAEQSSSPPGMSTWTGAGHGGAFGVVPVPCPGWAQVAAAGEISPAFSLWGRWGLSFALAPVLFLPISWSSRVSRRSAFARGTSGWLARSFSPSSVPPLSASFGPLRPVVGRCASLSRPAASQTCGLGGCGARWWSRCPVPGWGGGARVGFFWVGVFFFPPPMVVPIELDDAARAAVDAARPAATANC